MLGKTLQQFLMVTNHARLLPCSCWVILTIWLKHAHSQILAGTWWAANNNSTPLSKLITLCREARMNGRSCHLSQIVDARTSCSNRQTILFLKKPHACSCTCVCVFAGAACRSRGSTYAHMCSRSGTRCAARAETCGRPCAYTAQYSGASLGRFGWNSWLEVCTVVQGSRARCIGRVQDLLSRFLGNLGMYA